MAKAVLLTGANIGDVAENLKTAARMIGERIGTISAQSEVMESEPWGFDSDDMFFNQALVVETELSPERLLEECQKIENELGRKRDEAAEERTPDTDGNEKRTTDTGGVEGRVYQSRTMDIDILFYGDLVMATPVLTIPHPRIAQRQFVLEPLAEVMPDYVHPLLGKTVAELLKDIRAR